VRRLLNTAEILTTFNPEQPWTLSSKVALRDESFGALAYHYGNRRLVFLKSRDLVDLVRDLEHHDKAADAIVATVGPERFDTYVRALDALVESEVICER
jgi:mycofactocin biosynthesis protein MftB